METIVRVKVIPGLKEMFVSIPSYLYDNALLEKKSCQTHSNYCYMFDNGKLKHHEELHQAILNTVGAFDVCSVERINQIN